MTMLEPTYETISVPSSPNVNALSVEEEIIKDQDYYLETLSLKVNGVTLKVPAYPFKEESETFASQHGLGEDKVIELDDVNLQEFKDFLSALLPKHSRHEKLVLSKARWISTLKVATQYHFNDLRKIAVDELSPVEMDPIERVYLAKEFKIPSWLLSGYRELVERPATITEDEASKIGHPTALRLSSVTIHRLRDRLAGAEITPLDDHIQDSFQAELADINLAAGSYPTMEEKREIEDKNARKLAEEELLKEEREKRRVAQEAEDREKERIKAETQKREAEHRAREEQEAKQRDAAERHRLKLERERQLRRLAEEEEKVKKELEALENGGSLAQGEGCPTQSATSMGWGWGSTAFGARTGVDPPAVSHSKKKNKKKSTRKCLDDEPTREHEGPLPNPQASAEEVELNGGENSSKVPVDGNMET